MDVLSRRSGEARRTSARTAAYQKIVARIRGARPAPPSLSEILVPVYSLSTICSDCRSLTMRRPSSTPRQWVFG